MKLTRIEFGDIAFRKLKDISIDISQRITVIAGHNGIGKSTILGLIANCSSLSRGEKSLFGRLFKSDFQEAFYLDYYADYDKYLTKNPNSSRRETPRVLLKYRDGNGGGVDKACSVSLQKRKIELSKYKSHMVKVPSEKKNGKLGNIIQNKGLSHELFEKSNEATALNDVDSSQIDIWRLRIIPRTVSNQVETRNIFSENSIDEENDNHDIDNVLESKSSSDSGKVQIPTIYIGMSRMAPIGEIDDELRERNKAIKLDENDKKFIQDAFGAVLPYRKGREDHLIFHSFSRSRKKSYVPTFDGHDTFSISLGQDSLSSIVTALASFNGLKRRMGCIYKGGILVIDEVDAGFHPQAQEKLVNLLKIKAKELNLQIIMTTHSLTVIKKILRENDRPGEKIDGVVYLKDPNFPSLMVNPTYSKIKNDMLVMVDDHIGDLPIKVYFEDEEALFFFEKLLKARDVVNHKNTFGKDLQLIALSIGSDTLMQLYEKDEYFKNIVLMPDNDVYSSSRNRDRINSVKTICPLPGSITFDENTRKTDRNPEKIIYDFLTMKMESSIPENQDFWRAMPEGYTSIYVQERVLTVSALPTDNSKVRDVMKSWFNKNRNFIEKCKLVELWCSENATKVDEFIASFTDAVDYIDKVLKSNGR